MIGIVEVGPTGEVTVLAKVYIVEVNGAFLQPGLADMHVHLGYDI